MKIVLEIKPGASRLPDLYDLLSKVDIVSITDVGKMHDSFETASALRDYGETPIVNIAINDRSEDELRPYFEQARRESTDIVIVAGNRWNRTLKPTDMIKLASEYGLNVGAVINTNAGDPTQETELAVKKVISGAGFFLTQPVWGYVSADIFREGIYRALDEHIGRDLPIDIYWGIFPAKDLEGVARLSKSLDGVCVPQYILDMSRNGTNGVEISRGLFQEFRSNRESVYVTGMRYDTIRKIV